MKKFLFIIITIVISSFSYADINLPVGKNVVIAGDVIDLGIDESGYHRYVLRVHDENTIEHVDVTLGSEREGRPSPETRIRLIRGMIITPRDYSYVGPLKAKLTGNMYYTDYNNTYKFDTKSISATNQYAFVQTMVGKAIEHATSVYNELTNASQSRRQNHWVLTKYENIATPLSIQVSLELREAYSEAVLKAINITIDHSRQIIALTEI